MFSTILSLCPPYVQIPASAPCSQTPQNSQVVLLCIYSHIKWQVISVHFNIYVSTLAVGRQKIPNWMVPPKPIFNHVLYLLLVVCISITPTHFKCTFFKTNAYIQSVTFSGTVLYSPVLTSTTHSIFHIHLLLLYLTKKSCFLSSQNKESSHCAISYYHLMSKYSPQHPVLKHS